MLYAWKVVNGSTTHRSARLAAERTTNGVDVR